jgi:hypothetical protein
MVLTAWLSITLDQQCCGTIKAAMHLLPKQQHQSDRLAGTRVTALQQVQQRGIRALGVSAGGGGAVGLRNSGSLGCCVYGQPVDFAPLVTNKKNSVHSHQPTNKHHN